MTLSQAVTLAQAVATWKQKAAMQAAAVGKVLSIRANAR